MNRKQFERLKKDIGIHFLTGNYSSATSITEVFSSPPFWLFAKELVKKAKAGEIASAFKEYFEEEAKK